MADMTRHLKRWLTDKALAEIGGEFEGVIASVSEEEIRNRFTAQKSVEPVITFSEGGYKLVLGKTNLQKMINWFGPESNDWVSRRIRIFRQQVESRNAEGLIRVRWQRSILCEDPSARGQVHGRWPKVACHAETHDAQMPSAEEIFEKKRAI